MTMQTYLSPAPPRVLVRAERELLKSAEPIMVLSSFGVQKQQPKNKTDTIVFRRYLPLDAAANGAPVVDASNYVLSEGVTPNARTLTPQDVQVTLQQYGVLMKLTNKAEDIHEDDIPAEMIKKVGEHMGSLAEVINYGVVRSGTNVITASGGARNTINTPITLNLLRKADRQLQAAHAREVTQRIAPGVNFGTEPVAPSYLVFAHTDVIADIRNIAGFTPIEEYGSFKPVHDREVGKIECFRVISSPYFRPFANAGSSTLNGMIGGTAVDVYPVIVVGEDAWGQVALKGQGAVSPTYLPARVKNHANPMGMFGYVGADFWKAAVRLNEFWMVRIEVGATNL
jgi:N4-gp56 family major capsid protein